MRHPDARTAIALLLLTIAAAFGQTVVADDAHPTTSTTRQ